jgi:hypothetical protein
MTTERVMRAYTIPLPWEKPPMTKNQVRRMHYRTEARLRATAIEEAREYISLESPEPIVGAIVILHWRMATKRRMDGDGAAPTLALVIDALVLEGVLPDDSWVHVVHSGVTCHAPIPGRPGALHLSVTEVP